MIKDPLTPKVSDSSGIHAQKGFHSFAIVLFRKEYQHQQ